MKEEKEVFQVKVKFQAKVIHPKKEHRIEKVNIYGVRVLHAMNMVIDLNESPNFLHEHHINHIIHAKYGGSIGSSFLVKNTLSKPSMEIKEKIHGKVLFITN